MPSPTQDQFSEAVGAVVRELRLAAGFTQEELAHRAKSTARYVSDIENGLRNPTVWVLARVVDALGTTWEAFGQRLDYHGHRADEGRARRRSGRAG